MQALINFPYYVPQYVGEETPDKMTKSANGGHEKILMNAFVNFKE